MFRVRVLDTDWTMELALAVRHVHECVPKAKVSGIAKFKTRNHKPKCLRPKFTAIFTPQTFLTLYSNLYRSFFCHSWAHFTTLMGVLHPSPNRFHLKRRRCMHRTTPSSWAWLLAFLYFRIPCLSPQDSGSWLTRSLARVLVV